MKSWRSVCIIAMHFLRSGQRVPFLGWAHSPTGLQHHRGRLQARRILKREGSQSWSLVRQWGISSSLKIPNFIELLAILNLIVFERQWFALTISPFHFKDMEIAVVTLAGWSVLLSMGSPVAVVWPVRSCQLSNQSLHLLTAHVNVNQS